MKVQFLLVLLLSSVAYASGPTGAVTLVNKSSDVLTLKIAGRTCDAVPDETCTIELEPGTYNASVIDTYAPDKHEVASVTTTVVPDKENLLTLTNEDK